MSVAVAVPFDAYNVEKLAEVVSLGCEHRAWFSDIDWAQGEVHRRAMVIGRLSDLNARTWEVWRDAKLLGILQIDELVPQQDARCHFLFRDHSLVDKRQLVLNMMQWAFEHYKLHALRLEIPTYAAKLLGFARKALGFRYEAEQRQFSWPSSATPLDADAAKLGSRKHQAVLHGGEWCDLLLLSITADEFREWTKDKVDRTQHVATSRVGAVAQPASA